MLVDVYTAVEPEPSIGNLEHGAAFAKEGQYDLIVALGAAALWM